MPQPGSFSIMSITIKHKPIESVKEFVKHGHTYRFLDYNSDLNIYLFGVYQTDGTQLAWEVVKPCKAGDVYFYPSDECFGTHGRCVSYSKTLEPKMVKYFTQGW